MVELNNTHRFNDCNDMKTIMPNMRDGTLSTEERNALNSRVINNNEGSHETKSVKNQICHILQQEEIGYQRKCLSKLSEDIP